MRTLIGAILTLFFLPGIYAQECNGQRYYDELFDVALTVDVKFGEAPQPRLFDPTNIQELYLDVYEPEDDSLTARPLIIWAFGGAFVAGSKASPDIVALSRAFASRGYVNAAIDYRLSPNIIINSDTANFYEAVLKSTHDMRASIRFFYKDAATVNEYRIDTTRIYIGGVSAGAFTALHIAHLDELGEVPTEIDSIFQATGGFAGNSGNAGYSEDIAGVINLCGALLDTAWINPGVTTPIMSMHGTDDNIVPYGADTVTILNINLEVDGSSAIHQKLDQHGIENEFYTFEGAGHTPFVLDPDYLDTTIWFVRDFLFDLTCDGVTSVDELAEGQRLPVMVYPNPNNGSFSLDLGVLEKVGVWIVDQLGREVYANQEMPPGLSDLELSLPRGVYTLRVYSSHLGEVLSQKIMVR